MKINAFQTKLHVEDVVYFMLDNKVAIGIVDKVTYKQEESCDISYTDMCRNILQKIKNYFGCHKVSATVSYQVVRILEDGRFHSAPYMLDDTTAFKTKEELLQSL